MTVFTWNDDDFVTPALWEPEKWTLRATGDPVMDATRIEVPYRVVRRAGFQRFMAAYVEEQIIIQTKDLLKFLVISFPGAAWLLRDENNETLYNFRRNRLAASDPTQMYRTRYLPGTFLQTREVRWEPIVPDYPVDPFGSHRVESAGNAAAPANAYYPFLKLTISYDNDRASEARLEPNISQNIVANSAIQYITFDAANSKWAFKHESTTVVNTGGNLNPVQTAITANNAIVPMTEWTIRFPRLTPEFVFGEKLDGGEDSYIYNLRKTAGKVNSNDHNKVSQRIEFFPDVPRWGLLFLGWNLQRDVIDQDEPFNMANPLPNAPIRNFYSNMREFVQLELKFLEKNTTVGNGKVITHQHYWYPYARTAPNSPPIGDWVYIYPDGRTLTYQEADFKPIIDIARFVKFDQYIPPALGGWGTIV